jgi:wyosine [tRNA(Phe)-imidazoG37] synthetase (radical SAM superfamily)
MSSEVTHAAGIRAVETGPQPGNWETACGYARNFLNNRFVYVVVSPRAHGLSVGVNMNPDKHCNFDCVYCEVNRDLPSRDRLLDVPVMIQELDNVLALALDGRLHGLPGFQSLPPELLQLRHVALSGDGEPTLCPNFREAVQAIVHLRALSKYPFFKLVLVSNATGLDNAGVQAGLHTFTPQDELWLKLDGGTRAYIDRIDRPAVPIEKVLENTLQAAKHRPVVIQSLFPQFNGEEPPADEIDQFVLRLRELREAGARIALVQIYSAMRPTMHPECGHLSLRSLSRIAQTVRAGTGLRVEVY